MMTIYLHSAISEIALFISVISLIVFLIIFNQICIRMIEKERRVLSQQGEIAPVLPLFRALFWAFMGVGVTIAWIIVGMHTTLLK